MPRSLNANLTHYIDTRGCLAPASDRSRRLAEFLTQLVSRVTIAFGLNEPLGLIDCRHKRCRGLLAVRCSDQGAIGWCCNSCGDQGSITHWRNSFWDMLGAPSTCPDATSQPVAAEAVPTMH